jgi:hypothetical protein
MRISRSAPAAALALLLACGNAAAQTPPPAPPPTSDSTARPTTTSGAPAGSPAAADPMASSTRPRYRRDRLTEAEIAATTATSSALDLVRRLRPEWLRNRGGPSQQDSDGSREVQVWYNGRHLGDVATLRDVATSDLISLRWVDPIEARISYGPGNGRGVISITGR